MMSCASLAAPREPWHGCAVICGWLRLRPFLGVRPFGGFADGMGDHAERCHRPHNTAQRFCQPHAEQCGQHRGLVVAS
eukprot:4187739-Prymnesium_polylepis.1